ncbi:MAG TPA: PIN domain-containing protein [Blastocatellia bacterium]|nr:PIN domain-containing protein [Blastocatellia bacterium]
MFLDTSGLLCFLDRRDRRHKEAIQFYRNVHARLTSNYVLAEYVALAHVRGLPRQQSLDFSKAILADVEVEIFWVDEALHREAVDLLLARADKTYSLCDAVSFVLMRERGTLEALTTDKHFEQEGFVRLLKT